MGAVGLGTLDAANCVILGKRDGCFQCSVERLRPFNTCSVRSGWASWCGCCSQIYFLRLTASRNTHHRQDQANGYHVLYPHVRIDPLPAVPCRILKITSYATNIFHFCSENATTKSTACREIYYYSWSSSSPSSLEKKPSFFSSVVATAAGFLQMNLDISWDGGWSSSSSSSPLSEKETSFCSSKAVDVTVVADFFGYIL